jgi:DNA (cytosine-5)-methyltransferase 1
MTAYYNEIDPYAADWLRNLIAAGHIAPGHVDTRSIEDVTPNDLAGFTQCHFFAGIGVWSRALRLAGWSDDRAVWTGSCPCQPFSQAGKGRGVADERHLWPAWFHLIELCRPPVVFGEQVASPDGLAWFQTVHADMERTGYAIGSDDLCAAGVGAPHIRQRMYFVANNGREGWRQVSPDTTRRDQGSRTQGLEQRPVHGGAIELGDSGSTRSGRNTGALSGAESGAERRMRSIVDESESAGAVDDVGDADDTGSQGRGERRDSADKCSAGPAGVAGFWGSAEWIPCRDGKWRPVEPGSFPLAHGAPARVGRLRAYGNAIVAPLAAEFIKAYCEV